MLAVSFAAFDRVQVIAPRHFLPLNVAQQTRRCCPSAFPAVLLFACATGAGSWCGIA
jgi:hypothetical protein